MPEPAQHRHAPKEGTFLHAKLWQKTSNRVSLADRARTPKSHPSPDECPSLADCGSRRPKCSGRRPSARRRDCRLGCVHRHAPVDLAVGTRNVLSHIRLKALANAEVQVVLPTEDHTRAEMLAEIDVVLELGRENHLLARPALVHDLPADDLGHPEFLTLHLSTYEGKGKVDPAIAGVLRAQRHFQQAALPKHPNLSSPLDRVAQDPVLENPQAPRPFRHTESTLGQKWP